MIKQNWRPQTSHDACVPGLSDNLSGERCCGRRFQHQRQSTSTTARQNRAKRVVSVADQEKLVGLQMGFGLLPASGTET